MRRSMVLMAALVVCGQVLGADVEPPPSRSPVGPVAADDPQGFFDHLVARYQGLTEYRDSVVVEQVTEVEGQPDQRHETQIVCAITDGELRVETPSAQVRRGIGLLMPAGDGEVARRIRHRYFLWLAPHLGLRFNDQPLDQFREGVDEGFHPTEVETVTVENRELVRVQLRSRGPSADTSAIFELFVDPTSMLIERVHGEQRLPDGGSIETTLDITPTLVESEALPGLPEGPPVAEPAKPATPIAG